MLYKTQPTLLSFSAQRKNIVLDVSILLTLGQSHFYTVRAVSFKHNTDAVVSKIIFLETIPSPVFNFGVFLGYFQDLLFSKCVFRLSLPLLDSWREEGQSLGMT